jgi:hypothetical protein
MNTKARMARCSTVLQITSSLVLGSISIASAQKGHELTNCTGLVHASRGSERAFAVENLSVDAFTNQPMALRQVPATKGGPDSLLSYSMPLAQPATDAESAQPTFTSKVYLADWARTGAPQGWRIGGGGVLNYTTRNQRWHFLFRYQPELSALREDYDSLHAFSLVWQYSFGNHKPTVWRSASVPDALPLRAPPESGFGRGPS